MIYHLIQSGLGTPGSRHSAYLALAGGLLRWPGHPGEVHPVWEHFLPHVIDRLCELTEDDQHRSGETVSSTVARIRSGQPVQGFTSLRTILDPGNPDVEYHLRQVREYARELEELQGYERESETPDDWDHTTASPDYSRDEAG